MASPFQLFRRHQKVLMVVLTGLAMFAFIVMDALSRMEDSTAFLPMVTAIIGAATFWFIGQNNEKGSSFTLVGAAFGAALGFILVFNRPGPPGVETSIGTLSERQIQEMRQERAMANQFIGGAVRERKGQGGEEFFFGGTSPGEMLQRFLLLDKADKLNVQVSDAYVTDYILEASDKGLSNEEFKKLRSSLNLGKADVFRILATELRVRIVQQMLRPKTLVLPQQKWDNFMKFEVGHSIDAIEIPVEAFEAVVLADAQKSEKKRKEFETGVRKLFEEFKGAYPTVENPGFRQPERVQLAWLRISRSEIEKQIEKQLDETVPADLDKELRAKYDEDKETFYQALPDVPAGHGSDPFNLDAFPGDLPGANRTPGPVSPSAPIKIPELPDIPKTTTPDEGDTPGDEPEEKPASEDEGSCEPQDDQPAEEKPAEEKPAEKKPAEETEEKPTESDPSNPAPLEIPEEEDDSTIEIIDGKPYQSFKSVRDRVLDSVKTSRTNKRVEFLNDEAIRIVGKTRRRWGRAPNGLDFYLKHAKKHPTAAEAAVGWVDTKDKLHRSLKARIDAAKAKLIDAFPSDEDKPDDAEFEKEATTQVIVATAVTRVALRFAEENPGVYYFEHGEPMSYSEMVSQPEEEEEETGSEVSLPEISLPELGEPETGTADETAKGTDDNKAPAGETPGEASGTDVAPDEEPEGEKPADENEGSCQDEPAAEEPEKPAETPEKPEQPEAPAQPGDKDKAPTVPESVTLPEKPGKEEEKPATPEGGSEEAAPEKEETEVIEDIEEPEPDPGRAIENEIGTAQGDFDRQQRRMLTVPDTVFGSSIGLFYPESARGDFANDTSDFSYVYWATRRVEASVPETFEEVEDQVKEAYARREAQPAAEARAKRIADHVSGQVETQSLEDSLKAEGKGDLKELTVTGDTDADGLEVITAANFSWLTQGRLNPNALFPQPTLGQIEGVKNVNFEFMKTIAEMDTGDVKVIPNADRSAYYVVHLTERIPDGTDDLYYEASQDVFMKEQQDVMSQFKYMTLTEAEGRAIEQRWMNALFKEYNVDLTTLNSM